MGAIVRTTIISGFPGIGKSYLAEHFPMMVRDLESSVWHWIVGQVGKQANPKWPGNYIEQIKALDKSGMYRAVCVSSHQLIRSQMANSGIKYTNIVPDDTEVMKAIMIQRYKDRGSPESFIKDMEEHYSEYVQSMIQDKGAAHVMVLDKTTLTQWDGLVLME